VRISNNVQWQHLMANYKAAYVSLMPPLQYNSDQRPVGQSVPCDQTWVTPTNPYGFGFGRQFDQASGISSYLQWACQSMQGNSNGMIFWNPQGWNPRGCAYRPDFDIFPPTIDPQMDTLSAGISALNMRAGLATRPSQMVTTLNWTSDQLFDLDGGNPSQMAMLWTRFSNMISRGYTMFYMDSFLQSTDDQSIIEYLRSKMGPNVLTYSEFSTDLSMTYSGRYGETVAGVQDGSLLWNTAIQIQVLRWLLPTTSFLVVDRGNLGEAYLYQNKFSPMINDGALSVNSPYISSVIAPLNAKYLKGSQWN
jgi:hypothetical protein